MNVLPYLGLGLYVASTVAYLAALWTPRPGLVRAAHWLFGVTLAVWAVVLMAWAFAEGASLGLQIGLGVSAGSLGLLFFGLLRRYPIAGLGSFVAALSTLLAVLAVLVGQPRTTEGALHDWLLVIHIGLAFIGITAFAFATAVSTVYLIQARMLKQKTNSGLRRRLPPLDVLDKLALRGIIVGFPFYTVALLLGSARALRVDHVLSIRSAYILAFVSWLIYGVVLQARLTAGWRGRRAAILTMAGLVVAMGVVAQYGMGSG